VTTAVLKKLAAAGAIDASERVVVIITGEGLKTLDAVREGFELTEIEPTLASFEAGVDTASATVTVA
jgi:threonine synthase